MMRRIFLFLLSFLPIALLAQNAVPMAQVVPANTLPVATTAPDSVAPLIRFGYLSYDAALKTMFDYAEAQDSVKVRRDAYEKEMQRVEEEFNQKYESFLEGQREFPRTILLKRQNELQDLMKRNVEFKAEALRELQDFETMYMKPVKDRLNAALTEIAKEQKLALIINTDANACPFIDPQLGVDIQMIVEEFVK